MTEGQAGARDSVTRWGPRVPAAALLCTTAGLFPWNGTALPGPSEAGGIWLDSRVIAFLQMRFRKKTRLSLEILVTQAEQ